MVHKKYIKRDGKIFGPYLYENYRENGVTKTRYLGKGSKKEIKKNNKKKVSSNVFLFAILGLILFVLIFSSVNLYLLEKNKLKSMFFDLEGELASESLDVLVQIISVHAPEILDVDDEIYVCENTRLSYFFNVTDENGVVDENGDLSLIVDISDKDPFFITSEASLSDENIVESEIFSFEDLNKQDIEIQREGNNAWAVYPETITANDGELSDSFDTEIIVIEVNNPPVFDIGAQTIEVYSKGDNNTFYYDLGGFLAENGEETLTEDLVFDLEFLDAVIGFFDIDENGVINLIGDESFILSGDNSTTYHLNLSVQDTGLNVLRDSVHPNIDVCYDFSLTEDAQTWSDDFYLTITKENRVPEIMSYYPLNLSLEVLDTDNLYFNLSARDADWTPLDVYWYVDSVEKKKEEGIGENDFSDFEYSFGCGVSGEHVVKALVTDGLSNVSIEWNLSVGLVACPYVPTSSGGGGSGGLFCEEKWGCEEWSQCENFIKSIVDDKISKENELLIKERCKLFNYSEEVCGFQTRGCVDANKCHSFADNPGIIRECYFTENPNCGDSIKNCHEGGCEVLVDCGGPCNPCPTCSDNIKNQDETKIDCGGSCKSCIEVPFTDNFFKSIISYSLIGLLILVCFLVYRQVRKYKIFKKTVEKIPKKEIVKKVSVTNIVSVVFLVLFLFLANNFILNFAQTGKLIPEPQDMDFLASYGLINNFIKNLPFVFLTGPIINGDTRLEIWDDTDSLDRYSVCTEYCAQKQKPSSNLWTVYFYANYTDNTDYLPISPPTGDCEIQFQDSQGGYGSFVPMVYNSGSGLFEYVQNFDYNGDYNFNIDCLANSIPINAEENFVIINTEPYILKTAAGYIDMDADGEKESLQCFEDTLCYYNFTLNVSEDDVNDVLIYDYLSNSNTTLTDFIINSSTGILEINITHSDFTGSGANAKKVELSVQDSERTVSAILEVDVNDVNDAPFFINLENKTLGAGELFKYLIGVGDEEDNVPFEFNMEFSCDSVTETRRGNCTLFTEDQYSVNGLGGLLDIEFIPNSNDLGIYNINFSVKDNNLLGNKTTSEIIEFKVEVPMWNNSLDYNYSFVEDQLHSDFPLDLNLMLINVVGSQVFSYGEAFPSFDLTSGGIMDFIPGDAGVGNYEVEITAEDSEKNSSKIFNFTTQNINDNPQISLINAEGHISLDGDYNLEVYENADVKIFLFVEDGDFLISEEQKSFYNESLDIELVISGPNLNLFEFNLDSINGDQAKYNTEFIPRELDVGDYNIAINVTDKSGVSDSLSFNLTVIDRDYDVPIITYPDEFVEFNFKENISSSLMFRVNHSVGDNLTYRFYLDDVLNYELDYYGNNRNLTWNFIPNFTDETYNEINNLSLFVVNPYFSDLNATRIWNVTINHTNFPVEFIRDIGDKEKISLNYALEIDLKDHFRDLDFEDVNYNQSVRFDILSEGGLIHISSVSLDWIFAVSSSVPAIESLNITAYDLNMTNNSFSLTNISSNNFIVEFVPPTEIPVPVPTPVSRSKNVPISLKILMPGEISAYGKEKIEVPLRLVNSGQRSFNGLSLNSSAIKDGNVFNEIRTSLNKNSFDSLKPGEEKNLTLSIFFDTEKLGDYEVLVNVESKSPSYKDWGKIHINLQAINESQTRELILFTQEFLAQNPECIEIKEIISDASEYFEKGDYENSRIKTKEAITACEETISQTSVPRLNLKDFSLSVYFGLGILIAFIFGIIYYFYKRRKLQRIKKIIPSAPFVKDLKKKKFENLKVLTIPFFIAFFFLILFFFTSFNLTGKLGLDLDNDLS